MAKCVPQVGDAEEEEEEEEEMRTSRLQAYSLALGMLPSMITRAACELGIPDLLLAEPLSALQIAQKLSYPSHPPPPLHKTADNLERLMRCLCAHGVFKAHVDASLDSTSEDPVKYCLTPLSTWLLRPAKTSQEGEVYGVAGDTITTGAGAAGEKDTCTDATGGAKDTHPAASKANADVGDTCRDGTGSFPYSLRDFLLLQTCATMQPLWQHLSEFILKGGEGPFFKACGVDGWTFINSNPQFSRLFHDAMYCDSTISVDVLLRHYHGFEGIHTLVDVGGGIGTTASYIVAKYPTIKAITFDLPRVIATAPNYPGVQLVGGDMFEQIPEGDAIFLKLIFYNWDDEKCIKILKNCHKVLPKNGKVVIMDGVLAKTFNHEQSFNNLQTSMDMLMMATALGGKGRTIQQWEFLLKSAEFPQYKLIELPCLQCIIEAFPTFDKNRA